MGRTFLARCALTSLLVLVSGGCSVGWQPDDDAASDDDAGGNGDIVIEPAALDFGAPALGAHLSQPLTIRNEGPERLTVTDLEVFENDGEPEYSLLSAALPMLLEAGEEGVVDVGLTTVDDEVDTGTLTVTSDDADEPTLHVPLISAQTGSPVLDICVVTNLAPPDDCADPWEIDLGLVPYGGDAFVDVLVRNTGSGNRVIQVDNVAVVSLAVFRQSLYTVELLDAATLQPMTLPVFLSSGGGDGGGDPIELLVELTFTAVTDGFLVFDGDRLEVTTEGGLVSPVPISGAIDGCPPDLYDADQDVLNGCECTQTNGGDEICDGVDNNCDGLTDEGCVDADGDGFNVGEGDCDDQDATVYPGAPELCDGKDNDCDTLIDEDFDFLTDTDHCGGCNSPCYPANATGGCNNGICEITACDSGYHNLDLWAENGCECAEDGDEAFGGDGCGDVIDLGTLTDSLSAAVTVQGNLVPDGDEDWYLVEFDDSADADGSCDPFHAQIYFSTNPGYDVVFDVLDAGCGPGAAFCDTGGALDAVEFDWVGGECPCRNGTPGVSELSCTDQSMTTIIRVHRATGLVTCSDYVLEISNGY